MRIIDKTPLQDKNGEINIIARIQGTLKYGLNWYAEMQAQKAVIAQLDRLLEKGFVLIRNFTLPNSEIIIPTVLIGTGGIWVMYITNAKGYFEAKGDQWNIVSGGRPQPARINLIRRAGQLTRAFQKYLEIQKFDLPVTPEAVLIAADPGAQIESVRPAVRVVRSDAIKQFAASLMQARPAMPVGLIYDLADWIIDPSLRKHLQASAPAEDQAAARARAIFDASEPRGDFNPRDLGFAFEDGTETPAEFEAQPAPAREPPPAPSQIKRGLFGMSRLQTFVLAVMALIECCILTAFAFMLLQIQ
jgi:hypothetical protein